VFDTSIDAAPIQEGNLDPILPEERFILELIGFERSGPDQFRKDGGFKLTFAVFNMDGSPFEFKDEPYELWRTIDKDRNGQPVFNLNTQAHDWASALLGRTLGVDDKFSVSELRNKRMSAMVVWRNKRPPAKGKTFDLASLRHVPVGPVQAPVSKPAPGQVTADATDDEIDRALLVGKLQKQIARLAKLDADEGARAEAAVAKFDLDTTPLAAIQNLLDRAQTAIQKAMDD
jgi:hypothetical protein